jgi:hypothetical protein
VTFCGRLRRDPPAEVSPISREFTDHVARYHRPGRL